MEKCGGYPSQAQMAQHLQHYPGTPSNVKREWYTNHRDKHVSEPGHRPSDDSHATCEKIAKDGIQTRPQERTERVICKECESAGTLDSSQRRSDTIQSRDELRDDQRAQAPSRIDVMRSLRTIVRITAEDAEYPYDLAAPVAPGFEPNKIAGEASQDTNDQHQEHMDLAASRKSSSCQ